MNKESYRSYHFLRKHTHFPEITTPSRPQTPDTQLTSTMQGTSSRTYYVHSGLYGMSEGVLHRIDKQSLTPPALPTRKEWLEALDGLPPATNLEASPGTTCAICLDDLNMQEEDEESAILPELPFATHIMGGYPITLPCEHSFHIACAKAHFVGKTTCPLCRRVYYSKKSTITARREAFESRSLFELSGITIGSYLQVEIPVFIEMITGQIYDLVLAFADFSDSRAILANQYCDAGTLIGKMRDMLLEFQYESYPWEWLHRYMEHRVDKHINDLLGPTRRARKARTARAKELRRIKYIVCVASWFGLQMCALKLSFIPLVQCIEVEVAHGHAEWLQRFETLGSEVVWEDDEYLLEGEEREEVFRFEEVEVSSEDEGSASGDDDGQTVHHEYIGPEGEDDEEGEDEGSASRDHAVHHEYTDPHSQPRRFTVFQYEYYNNHYQSFSRQNPQHQLLGGIADELRELEPFYFFDEEDDEEAEDENL
ncbi:hypothetical protein BU16DRAFT_544625 [Lophium mytilinum]|uniref:RING-type domain-containing protein n=1 Tax=Lophium mytilinum TaxID=390894 RepID=A0A6A6QAW5_9PEZI|nr:hypothetical protein BU16DRAFT_544625 [Lophium mytilinum]